MPSGLTRTTKRGQYALKFCPLKGYHLFAFCVPRRQRLFRQKKPAVPGFLFLKTKNLPVYTPAYRPLKTSKKGRPGVPAPLSARPPYEKGVIKKRGTRPGITKPGVREDPKNKRKI
jgi:hypothetical protein